MSVLVTCMVSPAYEVMSFTTTCSVLSAGEGEAEAEEAGLMDVMEERVAGEAADVEVGGVGLSLLGSSHGLMTFLTVGLLDFLLNWARMDAMSPPRAAAAEVEEDGGAGWRWQRRRRGQKEEK